MSNNPDQQSVSIVRLFWYYILTLISLVFLTSGTHFEQWTWGMNRWALSLTPNALVLYDILGYLLPILVLLGYLGFFMPRIVKLMFMPRLRGRFFVAYMLLLYLGYAVAYALGVLGIVGWGQLAYVIKNTVASWYSFLYILGSFVLFPFAIIAICMRWWQRRTENNIRSTTAHRRGLPDLQ